MDYGTPSKVTISMAEYINVILHDALLDMGRMAATPARSCLFWINSRDPCLLVIEKKDAFVHFIMQLLYLSQQAWPAIRTVVSFLCSRLHQANKDDYKKAARVVKYL